jgi:sialate O-acetylesterase
MPARASLILSVLLATSAAAAPTIDPQFGSHAVVQRGKPIILSGMAAPGERISVNFAGVSASAVADRAGAWHVTFPALNAGGPYSISLNRTVAADDVMVGDVWLCSGQSNMEYPLRRALNGDGEVASAGDEDLRLMKVAQQLADSPAARFAKAPAWQRSSPDTARDFSAACTFMARDLRKTEKVPIGAIDDTWGGTPIRAWMSEPSAALSGYAAEAGMLDQYRRDQTQAIRRFGDQWGSWWRSKTNDRAGLEPWLASDRLKWSPVPSLGLWDDWGPEWKTWIGSAWIRKRVTLTPAEAAQAATLSLSAIDDEDQTFVNGIPVGGKNDPTNPRSYPLPRGVLKPGANEIMIFVRNVWGQGGFRGSADQFAINFADGQFKPLTNGWQYSRIADSVGDPPIPSWSNPSGISTIYNAMVAPLGPLGLKGVAWYQGEADVGKPGYDRRLAAWIANWREQFRSPDLPFLIVGLAGWGKRASHPVESGWASLINEQRIAVERDSRTALASAIDLGEPADIHPANKQEVGRRLALAAHAIVYRDGGTVGPLPISARLNGGVVVLTFSKPLQILSGANANAFELCGPAAGSCRYTDARVDGSTVMLPAEAQTATRVRYAWADYPIVNLYDQDMLPAPVFEIPIQ